MKQYLDLLQHIVDNGELRKDRTGIGTRSIFGYQIRFNLNDGFPAVTTKKLAFEAVKSELLWFIMGSRDERDLNKLLYGKYEPHKNTIWSGNINSEYWKERRGFDNDAGLIYGMQWRHWDDDKVDQLKNLIINLQQNPFSRRHIITAWNPTHVYHSTCLPPCHCFMQFFVTSNGELNCNMYQRSADVFLGVPFNIASYSLLISMLAKRVNLKPGELIISFGDAHIYLDHQNQVKEQLQRKPDKLPELWLNPDVTKLSKYKMEDIKLNGYHPQPSIKADMAV